MGWGGGGGGGGGGGKKFGINVRNDTSLVNKLLCKLCVGECYYIRVYMCSTMCSKSSPLKQIIKLFYYKFVCLVLLGASFFHTNPASSHRLVPWLNREIEALLGAEHVSFITKLIMSTIER